MLAGLTLMQADRLQVTQASHDGLHRNEPRAAVRSSASRAVAVTASTNRDSAVPGGRSAPRPAPAAASAARP